MKIIDIKDFEAVSRLFRGEWGHRLAEFIMHLVAFDKVNWVYEHSEAYSGSEFTSRLLDDVGVSYVVGNAHRLRTLPDGAFITVSNHPYGGLDGIMSIDLFAGIRPDYRFTVNKLLAMIKTMGGNFIPVIPAGKKRTGIKASSIRGVRETLEHLRGGHPVGFFPSGAVSDLSLKDFSVRDRSWQESVLHIIHAARVPILPVRFFDKNSFFFYFLGLINWRVRLLRLPTEVFNKNGQNPRIGIGELIPVKEQQRFPDTTSLSTFLRKVVYGIPLPASFVPGKEVRSGNY